MSWCIVPLLFHLFIEGIEFTINIRAGCFRRYAGIESSSSVQLCSTFTSDSSDIGLLRIEEHF